VYISVVKKSGGKQYLYAPFNIQPSTICFFYRETIAGWWFGTLGLFFHILGMSSSELTFIFFRGVGTPPTSITSPLTQIIPIKSP
jgi:hypothetical protein